MGRSRRGHSLGGATAATALATLIALSTATAAGESRGGPLASGAAGRLAQATGTPVMVPPLPQTAALPLVAAAGGEIRAVVIGIDTYANPDIAPTLAGAVADARDIAAALARAGARDVTVLLDREASRARLARAMTDLAARARPEDLVVVTFAGHGSREPVPPAKLASEPDGYDEYFLLWGFGTRGAQTRERLLDDEMFQWLSEITRRGTQVVFLADACFGGGMTKAVDPRVARPSVRAVERVERPELQRPGAYFIPAAEDQLAQAVVSGRDNATIVLPTLTFIAAVDDGTLAPEVPVAGEATMRGAASYALARALEGQADAEGDRDGRTTRRELFDYVRRHVRILSANRQSPVLEPRLRAGAEAVIFRDAASPPGGALAGSPAPAQLAMAGAAPRRTPSASKAERRATALTRDPATGDIIDVAGMVVAYAQPPDGLAVVAARVAAYERLAQLSEGRALSVEVTPADRDFRIGDRFTLEIGDLYGRYLILVNLAGDGRIQMLFPKGNADPYWSRDALAQPMRAAEPPGADTLLVIAGSRRLRDLETDLTLLDGERRPEALVAAIERALGPQDRLGLATYTTKPR